MIQDKATMWVDCFPKATKGTTDCIVSFQQFVGPKEQVRRFYTDGAQKHASAAHGPRWRHDVSTPHRPQSNGVAEHVVRRVLEGSISVLMKSGLPTNGGLRRHDATALCGTPTTISKLRSRHHTRCGAAPCFMVVLPLSGRPCPTIRPLHKREVATAKKFDGTMRRGIFIGYHIHAGEMARRLLGHRRGDVRQGAKTLRRLHTQSLRSTL